jgi:hypothetical protein
MFRRMALSIFGGALLAVVFAFSQTGMAACGELCPDTRPGGLEFDSCIVIYVSYPDGSWAFDYTCYYTSGPVIID